MYVLAAGKGRGVCVLHVCSEVGGARHCAAANIANFLCRREVSYSDMSKPLDEVVLSVPDWPEGLAPSLKEEPQNQKATTREIKYDLFPELPQGDSVLRSLDAQNCTASRNVSRSMEDLFQNNRTTTQLCHKQQSMPILGTESKLADEVTTQSKEESELLSPMKLSQRKPTSQQEEHGRELTRLKLPASALGQEMHYDYVRMFATHQRISSFKQQTRVTRTSLHEGDSDEGYVIEYHGGEETDMHLEDSGEIQTSNGAESKRQQSPRPPIHLHKHPSVVEFESKNDDSSNDDSSNDDYEELIIYEELNTNEDHDHHYDRIHEMRDRVTQMVRGKHRKKLKKFIVKRKSFKQLANVEQGTMNQTGLHNSTTIESESDSSGEEEDGSCTKRNAETTSKLMIRRRHTTDARRSRQSLTEGMKDLLDKSQYDQVMEVMMSDREVKQLQDAGIVKIKDIAELRAEIKQIFQNAPSVPPPLPGHARPRAHRTDETDQGFVKKWSSKSLKY